MESETQELELQQALQRFTTQFSDRVVQATERLERSTRVAVRDNALRKSLLYVSSAIEIATGADPRIGLLDMVVFVRLCRAVLINHWIPTLYGDEGAELAEAFARADDEISQISERALGAVRQGQLTDLVDAWLAENPDQARVEGVRLTDFAAASGRIAADRALQARGLLSSMRTATRAANDALMLAERGLFILHRLPFLWRGQARVGAREIVGDAVVSLLRSPDAPVARIVARGRRLAAIAVLGAGLAGAVTLAVAWFRERRSWR